MAGVITTGATGNQEIDGLLYGSQWTGAVTYSFPDSSADYAAGYGGGEPTAAGFSQAPAAMQAAVTYALTEVSSFTNLTLTYAGTGAADIRVALSSTANPTSYAYFPSVNPKGEGGDVWFGTQINYSAASLGTYAFVTALHELGHALGLKHSQETGGVANEALPAAHDNLEFTVMSYRSYADQTLSGYTNEAYGFSQSYMANDVLALQTMYGANYSFHGENTVYSWSPTTGQEFINGVAQLAPGNGTGGSANRIFETVWDGDGVDTYDMSNYTTGVSINLNPGASSITSTAQLANLGNGHFAQGNIYNAYEVGSDQRSLIDNAVGGSGNDTIVGNDIANTLTGGDGNDILTGGGGNDTIIGGAGSDIAVFSGNRSDYVITYITASQSYTVADQRAGTPDGTDTLNTVEIFRFADTDYTPVVYVNHAPVVTGSNVTAITGRVVAATSLFSASDADGDALTYYFLDGNSSASSGHFVLNGVTQAAGSYFTTTAAQLSQLSFVAGVAGSVDNISVNTFDGTAFGTGASLTVTATINHAPVMTAVSTSGISGRAIAATSLFSATDADGDTLGYYFLDANSSASSGHFVLDGVVQAAGSYFTTTAAQLSQLSFVAGAVGTVDDISVNSFDGTDFGNGASLSVTATANHAPVVTGSSLSITSGHAVAATSLFSAVDADGDAMGYYFLDSNADAGSGHFVLNGVVQAAGSYFATTAAELSQLSFVAGAVGGVDSISVNTFDGTDFGNGASLTVTAAANHAPVVTASNLTMASGHSLPASSLFLATDADNDALSYYFLDGSSDASSGHFVFNGVTQAAGSYFTATAAQLSQVSFVAGAVGSVDSISVNTFDGTDFGNGASLLVTATDNHAPVVTASNLSMATGHSLPASVLFSATDVDNDTLGYYFLDASSDASSGHFVFNGVTQAAGSYFTASAAQLSQVSFVAGAIGSVDSISVNTFDGTAFGNGATLQVTATANHAPVVAAVDLTVASGVSVAATSLFTATDVDHDAMTYYFLDGTAGAASGHFVFNGETQAAGSYFTATAAQLSQVSFVAGAAGSIDSISVNTFDGTDFGNGASLHLTAVAAAQAPATAHAAEWLLA